MAADSQRQEASSNDLFGRWLAHHHEQQSSELEDQPGPAEDTAEAPPGSRASRRLPAAAVASSALDRDPLIGSRIAPPSTFGRKSAANAPQTSDADRDPPPGWEPIVMRSIRKKTEQAEAKQVPKPVDTRSRLQRLKARLVDAPELEPDVEVETPLVPLNPPVARSVPLPVTRSLEETIRAAVPTVERPVARHSEPRAEEKPAEHTGEHPVESHVEQKVGRHVGRHAQPQVEPVIEPVVEQVVEQVAPVAQQIEPEDVAPPTPVRAFIEATPVTAPEPEPVAVEPEPYVAPEPVVVEPEPEPVAESVVFEAEPEPAAFAEPAPIIEPVIGAVIEPVIEPAVAATIEVEPSEPSEPTEDQPAKRGFLSRPRRQPREPKSGEPRESGRKDRRRRGDAARDQVAAKTRARATSPASPPEPEAELVAELAVQPAVVAAAAPPEPAVAKVKVSKHDQVATEMPGVYKFAAKRTSRRLLTISLLIGAVASAYFVRAAVEVKDTPSIGLAAIVILATLMVWAIRGGASVTTLEVHQGQLQVIQQGGRFIFDLASQYTRFEVHGQPGHRGWKVLFPRRGMAPFTVDASMVDPDDFMRVLRFFRPQLVTH